MKRDHSTNYQKIVSRLLRNRSSSLGDLFSSFKVSDRQTERQKDKQTDRQTKLSAPTEKKRRMTVSLSLGNTQTSTGTLRGKGRDVRRSLANIFETEGETVSPERHSLERVDEETVGVKQLGKLLEKQLSGAERQDGFSYFAGDKPRLEEERGGGVEEEPGPSHRYTSNSPPGPGVRTASSATQERDYEDLLRSLTPQPQMSSRRRRRSSASSSGFQGSAIASGSSDHGPAAAYSSSFQTSEFSSVRHSLEGIMGQDAFETVDTVETVKTVEFFDPYDEENDAFRVSTVSTISTVSDDEYVFFKAHDEEEEEEEDW